MSVDCPFCNFEGRELVWSADLAVAFRDGFPVNQGHTLIVPRRHVATYFDATPWEQQAVWQGVEAVKRQLDEELAPAGYNVGFNAGAAAGQTVMHLHVHVIPRFDGDVDDPRGGVRGVIPSKQKYDTSAAPSVASNDPFASLADFVPGEEQHFLPVLLKAIETADAIDIVAAFIQQSGIELIEGHLVDALARGARVRILTGDYLNITHPNALQSLYTLTTRHEELGARFYRCEGRASFHPKAYIFSTDDHGAAFVGSSNISATALQGGVEWNLKTTMSSPDRYREIRDRFERLYDSERAQMLTAELVKEYQARTPVPPAPEPESERPRPNVIQEAVLKQLKQVRSEGAVRGLVVLATGLGKTYLSAFDFAQIQGKRALFVAHREEILDQAAETWAHVHPDRTIGYMVGAKKQPDADLIFASVQTLSRHAHLAKFERDHFDYIVIDEFHHATAETYRRLLTHFQPTFLLGLTATPDRMDGASLYRLCDDTLVARVGLAEGIAKKLLVPFHYYGVKDEIDFEAIPWRSGRFETEELTSRYETEARAAQALREYRRHAAATGRRALVFCCSRTHADYMARYLRENGVRAASVHSGETSAPRTKSLEQLRAGELEAICAVDVFNEGVDLPDVNTIMMLRPTESPIIFLQQLGRGLRTGRQTTKTALTVVDFIGNHRSFLQRPQALLALTGQDVPAGAALRVLREGGFDLPEGCSIEIETAAIDMLSRVAKLSSADLLIDQYTALRESHGRRPTASELFASGVNLKPMRQRHASWFHFLADLDDLTDQENRVFARHGDWFSDLEKTQMTRSYKMIAIQALLDADQLHTGVEVAELARRSRDLLARDTVLQAELGEHRKSGGQLDDFVKSWREMPLRVLQNAKRPWFALKDDRFDSLLDVASADREIFNAMSAEIVDVRLREHRDKSRFGATVIPLTTPISMKVSHSSSNPILRFDRQRRSDIPEGEVDVVVDDQTYTFLFRRIAVNVVREEATGPNVLPRLMRSWFGPAAGHPGTRHRVELVSRSEERWELRRQGAEGDAGAVIPLGRVPYFQDLKVACGHATHQFAESEVQDWLHVRSERELDWKRHFVVRASGDSMNGGQIPIADGDLVLCEWASAVSPEEATGRICLVSGGTPDGTVAMLKTPILRDGQWSLRSQNPSYEDLPIDGGETLRVAARFCEVVEERRGPELWGQYDRDAIAALFGHKNNPSWKVGHRDVDVEETSHTVLMVNLRKPERTPIEHRYADRFTARDHFQWESQASTALSSVKAKRILAHKDSDRLLHLFVRYHTKNAQGEAEPLTYCGTLQYVRHKGEKPIRFWFDLDHPLPHRLWQAWSDS